MKTFLITMIAVLVVSLSGCPMTPVESKAKDAAAFSQGVIEQEQNQRGDSCRADKTQKACVLINKAVDSQNILIDAAESYCAWPTRPSAQELATALNLPCKRVANFKDGLIVATRNLNDILADLKGLK